MVFKDIFFKISLKNTWRESAFSFGSFCLPWAQSKGWARQIDEGDSRTPKKTIKMVSKENEQDDEQKRKFNLNLF